LEIIKTEFEDVEAFVYTSDYNNKFLTVSNDLDKSRVEEIKEEAKDKDYHIWTKKD
jgi:hypothetical protein